MKIEIKWILAVLITLLSGKLSLGQNRFDVSIEGPWLFYVEPNFQTNAGPRSVLVAIAPKIAGHNVPIFSTGNGVPIPNFGIYCVAFDDTCKPNDLTALSKDGYSSFQPVDVYRPMNWNWGNYSGAAFVFLLPLPDSASNDGSYGMTFQSSFPNGASNPVTTESGPHSIGIVLHYNNGPSTLGLLSCTNPPTASNCSKQAISDQDNSGTLRMTVRSFEDPAKSDDCDYHVHHAYHRMLTLLDPQLSIQKNKDKAYTGVPAPTACTACDPQQDVVPSECSLKAMGRAMEYDPEITDISANLDSLVSFLQDLKLQGDAKKAVLVDLPKLQDTLHGKFPSQSQLGALETSLHSSQKALHDLLTEQQERKVNGVESQQNLQIALQKEQGLSRIAEQFHLLSISGKDCRAPLLRIN
jgi:hypothetical protein